MLSQAPALSSAFAADVTFERLVNADKEPHNWLMNHRGYDGQRFSPLDRINKQNVKSMRLDYAVALGGSAVSENIQATPLVEDGAIERSLRNPGTASQRMHRSRVKT
jgi:alcohol dehydrogenase (cytochrome c)